MAHTQQSTLRRVAAEFRISYAEVEELWLERAGVREFEGGQSRDDADRDAVADVREYFARLAIR